MHKYIRREEIVHAIFSYGRPWSLPSPSNGMSLVLTLALSNLQTIEVQCADAVAGSTHDATAEQDMFAKIVALSYPTFTKMSNYISLHLTRRSCSIMPKKPRRNPANLCGFTKPDGSLCQNYKAKDKGAVTRAKKPVWPSVCNTTV